MYRLLAIEDVKSNIMNPVLLQVLGLVAFINAHKDLRARNVAESGTLPKSPVPVRRSLTFKCLTTVAVAYIALSAAHAATEAAENRETMRLYKRETKELHKLKEMFKLRQMYRR